MAKKKKWSSSEKARIALDAIRGEKTINQIAQEHEVHPNLVIRWKKEALENFAVVFEKGNSSAESDLVKERDELHRQLGVSHALIEGLKKNLDLRGVM